MGQTNSLLPPNAYLYITLIFAIFFIGGLWYVVTKEKQKVTGWATIPLVILGAFFLSFWFKMMEFTTTFSVTAGIASFLFLLLLFWNMANGHHRRFA